MNTGDGENTGDNGGSTVTPAVPAPAPVQNLTAAPAAVTVQTLAALAAAQLALLLRRARRENA